VPNFTNLKPSGGSILTTLLNSNHKSIKNLQISALVRGEDKAKVLKEHAVNPILFRDLDDSEAITRAASDHDSKDSLIGALTAITNSFPSHNQYCLWVSYRGR
jgi:hypothetical protein